MSDRTCAFEGCGRHHESHGLCGAHAKQKRKGWTLRPIGSGKPLSDRLWERVTKAGADECWEWQGATDERGYGKLSRAGRGSGMVYVHRVSYEMHKGQIPDGARVDHRCFNPPCVNPSHLRAVTQKQNQENRSGVPVNNASGVLGVYWDATRNRWQTRVKHHGVGYSAGSYESLDEAESAVIALRNKLFTHNDMDRSS